MAEYDEYQTKMVYQSGYNPFKIFGNIPVPPKHMHRTKLFPNCYCIDASAAESVYIRIKVGSSLRFNLIKVFGYILHRKQIEFNTAYYTSLYFILTCIKLNHVDILSLVDSLDSIAFMKPNQQFEKLFGEMEKHLPQYLRCAATFWKEGIKQKKIDMDKILIPYNDETLVINLLEGTTPQELKKIATSKVANLGGEAKDKAERNIVYNFNINILHLVRFFHNHKKLKISQWLIAGLLQFFPRTLIQPDLEESLQVMIQYLYEIDIAQIKNIDDVPIKDRDPYKMIDFYFDKLKVSDTVPDVIKGAAQTILRNLKPRNPTAVNPHYTSFTFFVKPDSIKINALLDYISMEVYPLEIVMAAKRVQYYIDQKIVGHFSIMMNFNPYLYSSPTEVLIAFLDRILRRLPNLKPEVLDSVGAVYSYLIFKYRYTSMPVVYPTDIVNMNVLFLGLKAPDIDKEIRNNLDMLISMLQKEQVKFSDILRNKVPIYMCTTPVLCLIELLKQVQEMKVSIVDEAMIKIITVIINSTCKDGYCPIREEPDPNDLFPVEMRITLTANDTCRRFTFELPDEKTTTVSTTTTTKATAPPPTTPTEGPVKTVPTSPETTPTTPTAPPPVIPTTTVIPQLTENPNKIDIAQLNITGIIHEVLKQTPNLEEKMVKEMVATLQSKEYKDLLIAHKSSHATVIGLYLSTLETFGQKHSEAHFKKYLTLVIKKLEKTKVIIENVEIESSFQKPIPIKLLIALPTPQTDKEKELFKTIKIVLGRQEVYDSIYKNIQKSKETTVATYLEALFREELKLTDKLSKLELEAIDYYLKRIEKHGFGEAKIQYSVEIGMLSAEINISEAMDNAIGFKSLDRATQEQFNAVIRYLKEHSQMLSRWDKWVFHPTAREFSKALLDHVSSMPSLDSKIREAVVKLLPKINTDGSALRLVFKN